MGKKTEAILVLDAPKKNVALFREEGQTGNWRTDPPAKLLANAYITNSALTNFKQGAKIKVTIEEIDG